MPRVRLTDRFCQAAKPDASGRTEYFDEMTTGLALRCSDGGRRSWSFFFTSPRDGKRARVGLGTYPAVTLAAARGRAKEAATHVSEGRDPRAIKIEQATSAMTARTLVDLYLSDPAQTALRSAGEKARRMRRNVVPAIGDIKIVEIRRRDVRNVTDPMLSRGTPVEAARCFEDVRAMIRWAVENEYLETNPIDGMTKPGGSKPRQRTLKDEEIAALWHVLPKALARSKQCQLVIRLCLVTCQRVGEVTGMTRDELNLAEKQWSIPGDRTKNGYAHLVPLSDLAIRLINEALAAAGNNLYAFPGGDDGFLSPVVVARTILRAHGADDERPLGRFGMAHWTAHDLRRTGLDNMARLGVQPHIRGHIANHRTTIKATVTESHYTVYDFLKEKRDALDLWADRLASIIGSGRAARDAE